jgi:hypothetical protein
LLNIAGGLSRLPGVTFAVAVDTGNATASTATISFSSPLSISSNAAPLNLGSLLASVPFSATTSYGAKQLLHFSSMQLEGTVGPIAVTNQDGLEVAAYFGDVVDAGGPLNLNDSSTIAIVSSQIPNTVAKTVPGFAAFPLLDPIVIGDVALQNLGFINSTDASVINQELVLLKPTIPYAPIGLSLTAASVPPTDALGSITQLPSRDVMLAAIDHSFTELSQSFEDRSNIMPLSQFDPESRRRRHSRGI